MPMKDVWCYHEAQKNVLERLQKDWEPPAVPCGTPMTSFLKKRIQVPLPNVHATHAIPRHLTSDRIPQRQLCASYNLQLNDLHVLMSRSIYQYGVQKKNPGKMWHNTVYASNPVRNIMVKRDYLQTPKIHDVVLKYGGPEASIDEPTNFVKKALSQKINSTYEVSVKKIDNSEKTFYIQMPKSKLRVGNLDPKKYYMQQKKKEPFIL